MKNIIHVAQQAIQQNRKDGGNRPPLIVRNYKGAKRGHTLIIYGQDGRPAARIVHSPHKPLSCGARVWIETEGQVEVSLEQDDSCPLISTQPSNSLEEVTQP